MGIALPRLDASMGIGPPRRDVSMGIAIPAHLVRAPYARAAPHSTAHYTTMHKLHAPRHTRQTHHTAQTPRSHSSEKIF